MKYSNISKLLGAGVVALGIALTPLTLPAAAQVDSNTTAPGETVPGEQGERDFDWGWLGLLGLIGLAGLKGNRKEEDSVQYRDANQVGTRSNYR